MARRWIVESSPSEVNWLTFPRRDRQTFPCTTSRRAFAATIGRISLTTSQPDDCMTINQLRSKLDDIDRQILQLVAQRQKVIADIGQAKRAECRPLRDFEREKVVIEQALDHAGKLGLEKRFVSGLMQQLIHYSLSQQERKALAIGKEDNGKRALVVGGAGKMGGWFVNFLQSKGYAVSIADIAVEPGPNRYRNWLDAGVEHELIIVAAPLTATNEILVTLADLKPKGLVIDISSIKTPIVEGISKLRDNGCQVASIHPMFGPDTDMLSGRHLIIVDTGSRTGLRKARKLFDGTMVELLEMSMDEHDRAVAFVLGLSHAVNIAFFTALARSGETSARLIQLSSTTFDAQLLVAAAVARENPDLYYEIQSLNRHGLAALDSLCAAADTLREIVTNQDREKFIELMGNGQNYFAGRRRADTPRTAGHSRRRMQRLS